MGTVYPISSGQSPVATNSGGAPPSNQVNQDMFLKLLVAQLKYQDPMNPTDSTQFVTQTAQFTEVETLQKIQKGLAETQSASQTLAASTMVGRQVMYALNNGAAQAPTGTSVVSIRGSLPKDAAAGTHATANTAIFTKDGKKIPLSLDFTKTADGWTVQAKSDGHAVGKAQAITFDATGDHSNGNLSIPADVLDAITGTSGNWPGTGVTLDFGDSNDLTRLQIGSGPATVTVAEQNGNDGVNAMGVVTGVHMTADGPQLVIGGLNIPLSYITDVLA